MKRRREWVARAGLVAALGGACTKEQPPPPPPPEVKAAAVVVRDVPVYVEAIAESRGSSEIEIRARVEGFVETVDFKEGTQIKKGDLLYTLDPRPLEASLAQAKGALAEAEAQHARTGNDVKRYEPLVKKNAISREQYETAVALERAAAAAVESAQAVVRRAEVDLGYTKVTAPDDGLVGKTEVHPGTLVGRGQSTLLTKISKIDPIHVRFSIAEKDYLFFARRKAEAGGSDPAREAPFELLLADGTVHPESGRLVFVDRNVDPLTGTILLEAGFPNPKGIVRPGQYGRVRVAVDVKKGAVLVPQRAIQELQGIYSVAVVSAEDTVDLRTVKPAERVGSLRVIDSGLRAGERIVVEGLQKVRPGAKVRALPATLEETASAPARTGG
jgi:membrane fusion protein, multidrug efflux system